MMRTLPGVLVLASLLLQTAGVHAQKDLPPTTAAAPPSDKMYEDIAVFRLLLNRTLQTRNDPNDFKRLSPDLLGGLTAANRAMWTWTLTDAHHAAWVPTADGVYLNGYGVVYSVRWEGVWPDESRPAVKPVSKPLSAWDQALAELRGEKATSAPREPVARPSLRELLVKLLAENGTNFKTLPENEYLTLAFTITTGSNCSTCHTTGSEKVPAPGNRSAPGMLPPSPPRPPVTQPGYSPAPPVAPPSPPFRKQPSATVPEGYLDSYRYQSAMGAVAESESAPRLSQLDRSIRERGELAPQLKDIRGSLLLFELHMRQGKSEAAAQALEHALTRFLKMADETKDLTEREAPLYYLMADYFGQLAQLQAKQKQFAASRQSMERARTFLERGLRLSEQKQKPSPTSTAVVLPRKIIFTVKKKQLDAVAAGKMTLEEFSRCVQIEDHTFPPKKP